jgi:beta-glucosidase/6-phospho-beta-glucosidase/beta-galactosidase
MASAQLNSEIQQASRRLRFVALTQHDRVASASIGCIHNFQPCWPSSASEADVAAAARLGVYWNYAFPDPQCRVEYPSSMRAAIEPHVQPAIWRAFGVHSTGLD